VSRKTVASNSNNINSNSNNSSPMCKPVGACTQGCWFLDVFMNSGIVRPTHPSHACLRDL
jgi:hypothetical protein